MTLGILLRGIHLIKSIYDSNSRFSLSHFHSAKFIKFLIKTIVFFRPIFILYKLHSLRFSISLEAT